MIKNILHFGEKYDTIYKKANPVTVCPYINVGKDTPMFRDLTRKKQQLSPETCTELLKTLPRGVRSVIGDEGYPYATPMNHYFCEEDGCIYFHGGKTGHKMDAIARSPKASLCVISRPIEVEDSWAPDYKSVIAFGRIELLEDTAAAMAIARDLSLQFTGDTGFIQEQIDLYGHETAVFRLVPEHITGKRINES